MTFPKPEDEEHSPPTMQCGPGSIPGLGAIFELSLLLVLVLAPRGFSPGTPVFPSPQNPTLSVPQLVLCAKYIDT